MRVEFGGVIYGALFQAGKETAKEVEDGSPEVGILDTTVVGKGASFIIKVETLC